MEIIQFGDKNLAHYAYVITSNGEIALIDPARNPQPYYDNYLYPKILSILAALCSFA